MESVGQYRRGGLSHGRPVNSYRSVHIRGGGHRFTVGVGKPKNAEAVKNGTKLARGANFQCVMSGTPISGDYINSEGRAGRMGERLANWAA